MNHPSSRFTIVAVITVFAGMAFVGTWVQAFRPATEEDRGNVPEIYENKIDNTFFASDSGIPVSSTSAVKPTAVSVKKTPAKKVVIAEPAVYPKRLIIPSINIDTTIQRVGITPKGNMGIPSNFSEVGWYSQGTIPGDFGSALIDGHVDNALGLPGVFGKLEQIKIGDAVTVVSGDGVSHTFTVTDISWYDYTDVPMEKIVKEKNVKSVRLITCAGSWIQNSKMYDKRLIVTAVMK